MSTTIDHIDLRLAKTLRFRESIFHNTLIIVFFLRQLVLVN